MNRGLSRPLVAVVVVTMALGVGAEGASTAASPKPLVFKLKEKHDSRISGTATLTQAGIDVRVVLRLVGPIRRGAPAHIHTGPCRREPTFANPRIWLSLSNVTSGRSVTVTARTSLKQLRARPFSINVHDPTNYGVVACGDVPRGG